MDWKLGENKANSKPNKANLEWNEGLFAYGARDCHGPSGLAMTSGSLCLSGFVAMRKLKKQSQFISY
jgi:hypothetical protein